LREGINVRWVYLKLPDGEITIKSPMHCCFEGVISIKGIIVYNDRNPHYLRFYRFTTTRNPIMGRSVSIVRNPSPSLIKVAELSPCPMIAPSDHIPHVVGFRMVPFRTQVLIRVGCSDNYLDEDGDKNVTPSDILILRRDGNGGDRRRTGLAARILSPCF